MALPAGLSRARCGASIPTRRSNDRKSAVDEGVEAATRALAWDCHHNRRPSERIMSDRSMPDRVGRRAAAGSNKKTDRRLAGAGRSTIRSQSCVCFLHRAAERQRRVALLHAANALELRAGGITSTASNSDDRSKIKGDYNSGLLAAQAHNDVDLSDLIALRRNGRFADHHVACRDIQQLVLFLDEKMVVHRIVGV